MGEVELPVALGDVVAGKYRVERLIGRGGMGSVFQATHTHLGQGVALKFLSSEALHDEDSRARFLREARAAATLTSENVAHVLDMGVLPNGIPFLVIELLEGEDLAARLKRGPLPPQEAAELLAQACEALGEAHAHGIVHRDVKPANLFLAKRPNGKTTLKVLDFGIAKMSEPDVEGITATHTVMGTPHYMAPEQMASTRNVDPRADVWALGVCLYECVTCRRPFESSNMLELGAKVLTGSPTPIRTHRADLHPGLVRVIERCLSKDPAVRFNDASELGRALAGIAKGKTMPFVDLGPDPSRQSYPSAPAASAPHELRGDARGETAVAFGGVPGASPTRSSGQQVYLVAAMATLLLVGLAFGGLALKKRARGTGAALVPSASVEATPVVEPSASVPVPTATASVLVLPSLATSTPSASAAAASSPSAAPSTPTTRRWSPPPPAVRTARTATTTPAAPLTAAPPER